MSLMKEYNCPNCDKEISIDLEKFIQDSEFEEEREMGAEYSHTISASIVCACGCEMEIVGTVWEYPEGVINLDETEIICSEKDDDE